MKLKNQNIIYLIIGVIIAMLSYFIMSGSRRWPIIIIIIIGLFFGYLFKITKSYWLRLWVIIATIFIPLLVALWQDNPHDAWGFGRLIFSGIAVILVIIFILGTIIWAIFKPKT